MDRGNPMIKKLLAVAAIAVSTPALSQNNLLLGQGYDNERYLGLSSCVKNSFSESPIRESELFLENSMSYEYLKLIFDIKSYTSSDKGVLTGEKNFNASIINDKYSHTFIYGSKYVDKTRTLTSSSSNNFTDFGNYMLSQDLDDFRAACGNRFVNTETLGGGLFFTVKLQFKDSEEKAKFTAKLGTDISAAKLSSDLSIEFEQNNIEGSVIIRAHQKGGDFTQLSKIINGQTPDGENAITSCSFKDIKECRNALNGLINYAKDEFPKQFTPGGNLFSPIKQNFLSYDAIGGPSITSSLITGSIRDRRDELSEKLEHNIRIKDRIDMLLLLESTAQDTVKTNALYDVLADVESNIYSLVDYYSRCLSFPNECISYSSNYKQSIVEIDESILVNSRMVASYIDPDGKFEVGLFRRTSPLSQHHVDFRVEVPPGYFAIGGGAESDCYNGTLLTASYPGEGLSSWVTSAKDHIWACYSTLDAYAVGLKLNGISQEQAEQYFSVYEHQSGRGSHPVASVSVPYSKQMVSGGFKVENPEGTTGNLGTASYPINSTTWEARSKDHLRPSPDRITAYAVAIDNSIPGVGDIAVKISSSSSYSANHPAATSYVQQGYILSGCGAKVNWSGYGNLLEVLRPNLNSASCYASSKDHGKASPATIDAYSIGLQIN